MARRDTTITFYGGVNEIGGNKILIKDRDTRAFFDFGSSFSTRRLFYSPPFLSPRSSGSLQELGILPKLEGVYKFDEKQPQIDAVFITHGHLDHSAYLSFINREIPIYCGETTRTILETLGEMRRADLEFNVEDIEFKPFRTGSKIVIDNLSIEPVHVDHSIPGAYGFVINTTNGSVIYTGDFRVHGSKPQMTREFVEKAKIADPVAIITEATNMIGASVSSETEVEEKLSNIIDQTSGIVLAEFACADVDRLNSFYRTAKKSKRCLAVSLKQAYLLDALRRDKGLTIPNLADERILLFRKSKSTRYKWEKQIAAKYPSKIRDAFDLSKRQNEVVLALSFYDLEELVKIKPEAGSCYILSVSEPFNEEMTIDHEKLVNWLNHYGLPQYHLHVSGHIMPLQLRALLREVDSEKIFPIHTENPLMFSRFMRDLGSEVVLPKKRRKYRL